MRNILIVVLIVLVVWSIFSFLKGDEYVGFFYPDANDLTNDIQSSNTFNSLEACRDWVDTQVHAYNLSNTGYDYECGKNCDLSGGKPYICEETLE